MTVISNEIAALRYLNQPPDSFWQWTDDGGAIQWVDGSTIIFTAELLTILQHQSAQETRGLPPLEAVILLVAATRENWSHGRTDFSEDSRHRLLVKVLGGKNASQRTKVLAELDRIHTLDDDVRINLEAKKWLAEYVFRRSVRTSAVIATEVLRLLGGVEEAFWIRKQGSPVVAADESLSASFNALYVGLDQITSEKIRLLRDTGIEEIPVVPAEPEFEFPEHDSIKSLIQALHSDQELYGLARAAQQLLSVMSLPRPMLQDQQLEQGGFSDIANRGTLDRLLLSELAYDDLTLAVRVAVNEAMYLRRESPPSKSPRRRVFLLDSGLRMWGVPRFLGTSVALALAGQSQDDFGTDANPFTTYSANGAELQEIDIRRRSGIAKHLKTLRPELDPSGSFPALENSLTDLEEDPEVVVITSPEASSDVTFRDKVANMAQQNPGAYFIATVARDGETRLQEMTRSGCKLLKQMRFDLEEVFATPPISKERVSNDLPAIFGVEPFPLLLSYHFRKTSRIWPLGTELMLAITRDARLMLSSGSHRGGVQLMQHIKPADHWWSSRTPVESVWYSIIGNAQTNDFRLLSFNEKDMSVEQTVLELKECPEAFCGHRENIFFIGKKHVSMIDRSTGLTSLNLLELEGKIHRGGRYFTFRKNHQSSQRWYALANNGLAPVFEHVPVPDNILPQVTQVFDAESVEGPVAVLDSGDLYFLSTESRIDTAHRRPDRVAVDEIGPAGNEIILRDSIEKFRTRIDVKTGQLLTLPNVSFGFQQMQQRELIGRHQLRTRFNSIGIFKGEILSLASNKLPRNDIALIDGDLRLITGPVADGSHSIVSFEKDRSGSAFAFNLKVARWEDGSAAWLDSRGLLHLRSSNQNILELTMTLSDGVAGGWLSNGRVWGNPFFLDRHRLVQATTEHAMEIVTQFTSNIISQC